MTKRTHHGIIVLATLLFVVLFLATIPAAAQDSSRPKKTRDRIELLESEVDSLEEKLENVLGADAPDSLRKRIGEIQSKIDDLAMQSSEVQEKTTAQGTAGEERDARLDDIAEEVSSLWKDVEAAKQEMEQIRAHPPAGYENGFFIGSKDGKFKLTINGFIRPFWRLGLQKDWTRDEHGRFVADDNGYPMGEDVEVQENGFGVANARLSLHAQLLDVIHGVFEIDYGTQTGTLQYPVNARVGNSRYGQVKVNEHSLRFMDVSGEYTPIPEFHVRVGQFKVPFDIESQFNADKLKFTTRSLMTRSYPLWGQGIPDNMLSYGWEYDMQRAAGFGRDTGIDFNGRVANGLFNYDVGVFNGAGDNVENDNRDVLVALRLSTDPAGPMTPGMSDLETSKSPLVSIGAAFAYDLLEHNNLVDPLATYNSSDINLTADAHFKWYGISALGAIFYRHADHGAVFIDENGSDTPIDSVGAVVQLAYFNDYTSLEPGVRYSIYDADMDIKLDHVHEIAVGLSYYPFVENLKIQVEYRGMYMADTVRTYLSPWDATRKYDVWFDHYNEITIMAQVAF
ncbi:MAG: hypothetical protein GY854_19105 [Deltaproteobacteria bacterium]|nr:hypothetical protein [Deltaproteobacteria bacterium]